MEKIYVKDLSLEIPHARRYFSSAKIRKSKWQLHSQAAPVDEGVFEVTVMSTVTARLAKK